MVIKVVKKYLIGLTSGLVVLSLALASTNAVALTPLPTPDPNTTGFGLEAVKKKAPPKRGATITTPGNGASFASPETTVSGICPTGLLVQITNNKAMVGSVMCKNGSFSLKIGLFSGDNELQAIVYDELDQPGPVSNTVKVHYTDANITAFGQQLVLTSAYSRRATATGSQLTWPFQLTGGSGPYAISIDWGDGTESQLSSRPIPGTFDSLHAYKRAGIYQVNIKAVDSNKLSAFLQVIAVSNGKVSETEASVKDDKSKTQIKTIIIWIPAAITFILLFPAYWLGRRSQLVSLRAKMQKERDSLQD